jgi:hypothetical protein
MDTISRVASLYSSLRTRRFGGTYRIFRAEGDANQPSISRRAVCELNGDATLASILYISDDQLAARGFIYSGPRQVTGLVRLVKVSISTQNY